MRLLPFVAAAVLMSAGITAHADSFDFSFSGSTGSGSGTFTGSLTSTPGVYLITSVTGTTNGQTIANLLPPGTYPTSFGVSGENDNDLYLNGAAFVDFAGISYVLADGTDVNLASEGSSEYAEIAGPNPTAVEALDFFTVTPAAATPEPSSFVLLGSGLLGVVGLLRKRLA
jgi:hypothetical protein